MRDLAWRDWLLTSGAFAATLLLLPIAAFFGGDPTYDFGQSVFPMICPRAVPLSSCFMVKGLPSWWSYPIWGVVAIVFGGVMRGRRIWVRVLSGAVVIGGIIALFHLAIHLLGLRQYIDAV